MAAPISRRHKDGDGTPDGSADEDEREELTAAPTADQTQGEGGDLRDGDDEQGRPVPRLGEHLEIVELVVAGEPHERNECREGGEEDRAEADDDPRATDP